MGLTTASIITLIIGLFAGGAGVYVVVVKTGAGAGKKAEKLLADAKKEAEKHKRDTLLELKEESYKLKSETDKEIKERKKEILASEDRLLNREKSLDKREEMLQDRDNRLVEKDNNLNALKKQIQDKELKMDELLKQEMEKLEDIAKFSKEQAHKQILERVENDMSREIAEYIKEKEAEAKLEVDKKAKNLLVNSMQRYSNDVTNLQTVTTISLPNDDMKGRLIGREGRNIRTIEAVTGVDLIIDDTPEAITISCFDPVRREIARLSLETLIRDGRIQPGRIEEVVDKTRKELDEVIRKTGENAIFELGISRIDKEIVKQIGKLKYRTSYGQNALQHSLEVAHLAGIMAAELGLNQQLAKRAGLLHDIGKAMDHEMEGSHVELGAKFAKKHGEHPTVINAIASHHGDVPATSVISILVAAADTLSAARPGSRSETIENYIQRLEKLEEMAKSFDGVDRVYAIQAGREIRIVVKPDKVDDLASHKIARDIKTKIEEELTYPGHIKVTVIREIRASEIAK